MDDQTKAAERETGVSLNAQVISTLRTVVPAVWGGLITLLITRIPALEQFESEFLLFEPIVFALITGAWYALIRKVEPHLPDWVRVIVIGAAVAPAVYAKAPENVVDIATASGKIVAAEGSTVQAGTVVSDRAA
jgi:chromate transport protein ChrA